MNKLMNEQASWWTVSSSVTVVLAAPDRGIHEKIEEQELCLVWSRVGLQRVGGSGVGGTARSIWLVATAASGSEALASASVCCSRQLCKSELDAGWLTLAG